jgi:succinate dehydrogenase/fumarate reductase flavoprotein subunit
MRWLWAATSTSSISVLGVAVNPIYSPVLMWAVGGCKESDALVKGLFAAGVVAWGMGVKRSDGVYVLDWFAELGSWWWKIAGRFAKGLNAFNKCRSEGF